MYHVVYRNEHTCVHNSMTSDHHPESDTLQRDEIQPNSESNDHQRSSEENSSFHATFTTINDQSPSETWPELSSEFWSLDNMISNYGLKPDSPLSIEDDLNYAISDGSYVNLWDFKEEYSLASYMCCGHIQDVSEQIIPGTCRSPNLYQLYIRRDLSLNKENVNSIFQVPPPGEYINFI
ncbi:hypothetical protein QJS04_geneDACA005815 [Acorus gramineus]|uniref:Uncharacterized protein n=1 Tax=Acorus gramineus TaxID=55184 RepID=A0AAV9B7A3_ACOGR|nr:hypothetical protein QJS04_geneDACA005815 [Acorus gramineus]